MSQMPGVFERAEFVGAGGEEHGSISSLPYATRPPQGRMGPAAAWKRSWGLLGRVLVVTRRCYRGFPGKRHGCVNFILCKGGVCSSDNHQSFAGFKNALLCPEAGGNSLKRLFGC